MGSKTAFSAISPWRGLSLTALLAGLSAAIFLVALIFAAALILSQTAGQIATVIGLGATLLLVLPLSRALRDDLRSLRRLGECLDILSSGSFMVEVPDRNAPGEIGRMARAVQIFKERLIELERLRAAMLNDAAEQEAPAISFRRSLNLR